MAPGELLHLERVTLGKWKEIVAVVEGLHGTSLPKVPPGGQQGPDFPLLTRPAHKPIVFSFSMDVAILTGADSRIGQTVARTLLRMGFRVHAIGARPDPTGFDERYYRVHACAPGKLAEWKKTLEAILAEENQRLDLLLTLGGIELTSGWEEESAEGLVRRLHGCLTEPLLAAQVCLPALRRHKGFLLHGHRRRIDEDLQFAPGFFEDSLRTAYEDLFRRRAAEGLRTARVLFAFPAEGGVASVESDLAEAVAEAFEVILRQKETCVVRELELSPRGVRPGRLFPDLVPGVDPYEETVLPRPENAAPEERETILIPTEKPRHYVQIAEVEEVTAEESGSADSSSGNRNRRRSSRSRGRSRRKNPAAETETTGSSDAPPESGESPGAGKAGEAPAAGPSAAREPAPPPAEGTPPASTPQPSEPSAGGAEAVGSSEEAAAPPAKKAAKKATRKTARKTATKKTAAKKTARKSPARKTAAEKEGPGEEAAPREESSGGEP
jgi:hypothetical protein